MRKKLNNLKLCVTILLILEILTGIIIIGMTVRYQCVLEWYLAKTERQTLAGQLSNIYVLGFELCLIYSIGFALWRFIWKSETIIEHINLLVAWNGFCLLVILCSSVTVWSLYGSVQYLQKAAAVSLFQGMDLYFVDPEWKLLWDEMQYYNECCGVNAYEDWKEAVWMLDEQSKCQTASSAKISFLIPYACCKRTVISCFQTYSPHLTAITEPILNSTDINQNGCLFKFHDLVRQFCNNIIVLMLIVLFLQILLLIFKCTIISKVKKLLFSSRHCSDDSDDRPLVVVKYPRNVRCITLTDEDNFDDFDEDDERHPCRSITADGNSLQHGINDSCERRNNIFLH